MALDTLTTRGTELALRAIGNLQPYLMLLTATPADPEAPTSTELLAAEVTMTNYARMRILGMNWIPTGSPKPYLENQYQLESSAALTGTGQTVTRYALVSNPTGATGDIYAVGTVSPSVALVSGKQIVIPAGYIRLAGD
jgi:hypothetical protein